MLLSVYFLPHPPILLPTVGSPTDRAQLKKTLTALKKVGQEISQIKPEIIVISSPHQDWGIKVPWHFVNLKFKIQSYQTAENFQITSKIPTAYPILTTLDSPQQHFLWGQKIAAQIPSKKRWVWLASGDMSHRLKEDGPYGLHPSGKKFDQTLIKLLKDKAADQILNLNPQLVEEASECGLRSFCMGLGALEASSQPWETEVLSYEAPFGVGYLVAHLKPNFKSNYKTKI
ncbi:hypothetical protein ACFLZP_04260 [Patescibacteria group bacterium]